MLLSINETEKIAKLLLAGQIGVLPTDTIYGIHCLACDSKLIQKVKRIKSRTNDMPMITLIPSVVALDNMDLIINGFAKKQMEKFWPGPNTLVFETCTGGTRSFRLPRYDFLTYILNITGPLISTSANLHGMPVAVNVKEALAYFGSVLDFYVDGGVLNNPPSSIYKINEKSIEKIR